MTAGIRTYITAQKQAMRELAIGERRYSALAKAGAIVTWQASADGTVLEAPGWHALTGLPDAALRDGSWLSVIHPEDQAAVLPNWVAVADADGSIDTELRILTAGTWRWVRVRGAPVYEPQQSEPTEWVGTIHDVHDRRAAQAALAESEARFVRAISAVGMGTWDWNLADDVLHLSPGYEALVPEGGRLAADRPRRGRCDAPGRRRRRHRGGRPRAEGHRGRQLRHRVPHRLARRHHSLAPHAGPGRARRAGQGRPHERRDPGCHRQARCQNPNWRIWPGTTR